MVLLGVRPLCCSLSLATLFLTLHLFENGNSFAPQTAFAARRSLSMSATVTADAVRVRGTRWKYKGHDIHTEVSGSSKRGIFAAPKPAVLLIHGFGCSTTYWRETTLALTGEGYQVHALDLLGQGKSAKPGRADDVEYSINLWADVCDTYARENIQGDVVLMGNSLGSVVALSAATGDFANNSAASLPHLRNCVTGICMFNCGIGLNSRGIAKEEQWNPTQRFLINFLCDVLNLLIFKNTALLAYVLNEVVTKDLLRDTLKSLYKYSPERVDDELVESFYSPAKEAGSVEALSQIYTNDPGSTPMEMHAKHGDLLKNLPIQIVWGNDDAVTPLQGGVGQFYTDLATGKGTKVSFELVECGHVPFDDNPTESNGAMLQWLEKAVNKDTIKKEKTAFGGLGRLFGQ
jgi:pimeloyl-ACP methyl ester carboxylesterase